MNIASTLGIPLLVAISVILLIGLGFAIKESVAHTGKKVTLLIALLRTLGVLAILALLLNPYYLQKVPDKENFSLVVLADVSGSMQAMDNPQTISRGAILDSLLSTTSPESIIAALNHRYSFTLKTFAEEVLPLTARYGQLRQESKATAIGDALLEVINTPRLDSKQLAGVVLLSDGHSNTGSDIQTAINRFQEENIPITIIGIGDSEKQEGITVRFEEKKIKTFTGMKTAVHVLVFNHYPEKKTVNLNLRRRKNIVDSLSAELPSQQETALSFSVTPDYVGIEPYLVTLDSIDGNDSLETSNHNNNNSDSVFIYSERSERRRVLYISDQLSPDYRFIKQSLAGEETIEFNSLVRLTADKFYQYDGKAAVGYPEQADFWLDYDIILMNTNVLSHLEKNVVKGLHDFVDKRGGGLLLFGHLGAGEVVEKNEDDSSFNALAGLLPGKKTEALLLRNASTAEVHWDLLDAPAQEYAPVISSGTQIQRLTNNNIAVRTLAWGRQVKTGESMPILQVQSYGAGKSAYWSVPDSWRWAVASRTSHKIYEKFWQHLVFWLGGGAWDRISFPEKQYFFAIEEAAKLEVDIVGTDFSPATNAIVEAVINQPDGKRQVPLFPDPKVPGRYTATYSTLTAGTHEVNYQALLETGEVLQRQTLMAFSYSQAENIENSFKPKVLRKLAYATKGIYYHYSDAQDIDIATIEKLPELEIRRYMTDNIFYLLGIILLLGGEWIVRRRWGLH